jgi:hypothetical protein
MRTSDSLVVRSETVGGTHSQRPGSKCIVNGVPSAFPVATLVTSLTVCTYDTPFRKISGCFARPRLGILPRGVENESVSLTKFSSSTLSLWAGSSGGAIKLKGVGSGTIGFGNVVVDGGPLLGRKIKLKPVPTKVPLKFSRTPKGGASDEESEGLDLGSKFWSTCWIWKGAKRRLEIPASKSLGADMAFYFVWGLGESK